MEVLEDMVVVEVMVAHMEEAEVHTQEEAMEEVVDMEGAAMGVMVGLDMEEVVDMEVVDMEEVDTEVAAMGVMVDLDMGVAAIALVMEEIAFMEDLVE